MKTGFYFTPREWQEWAAAQAYRWKRPPPMAPEPGAWIIITDGEGVRWRVDIISEDVRPRPAGRLASLRSFRARV